MFCEKIWGVGSNYSTGETGWLWVTVSFGYCFVCVNLLINILPWPYQCPAGTRAWYRVVPRSCDRLEARYTSKLFFQWFCRVFNLNRSKASVSAKKNRVAGVKCCQGFGLLCIDVVCGGYFCKCFAKIIRQLLKVAENMYGANRLHRVRIAITAIGFKSWLRVASSI